MTKKRDKFVNIGILGCGPIAQAGHFESVTKAHNARLFAICDVAEDLVERCATTHGATRTYTDYDLMLADPQLDAVIIATADSFHVPASRAALAAGKHVLCEKPLGVTLDEVEKLMAEVKATGLKLQVGHMKRFDPGLQSARDFIDSEMGAMLAFKGWYCDSTHRYPMTDAVQPLIVKSDGQRRPETAQTPQYRQMRSRFRFCPGTRFPTYMEMRDEYDVRLPTRSSSSALYRSTSLS